MNRLIPLQVTRIKTLHLKKTQNRSCGNAYFITAPHISGNLTTYIIIHRQVGQLSKIQHDHTYISGYSSCGHSEKRKRIE